MKKKKLKKKLKRCTNRQKVVKEDKYKLLKGIAIGAVGTLLAQYVYNVLDGGHYTPVIYDTDPSKAIKGTRVN